VFLFLLQGCAVVVINPMPQSDFSVLTWNIWHGGCENGEIVDPQRVTGVIKNSRADIVAMQIYGSGELISKAPGSVPTGAGGESNAQSRTVKYCF